MRAPLYEDIQRLSIAMVKASEQGNTTSETQTYTELEELCNSNESRDSDHPLQWEALGDFADNHVTALNAYRKGLFIANRLDLIEYTASIKFAMAEICYEKKDFNEAQSLALDAKDVANTSDDNQLMFAINDFLDEFSNSVHESML